MSLRLSAVIFAIIMAGAPVVRPLSAGATTQQTDSPCRFLPLLISESIWGDACSQSLGDDESNVVNGGLPLGVVATALPGSEAEAGLQNIVELAGPPATLLLVAQGVLFVLIKRSRRKCARLLATIMLLGWDGLQALPKLLILASKSAPARTSALAHFTIQDEGQRLASEAHAIDLDYIWMLRRMGAESVPRWISSSLLRLTNGSRPKCAGYHFFCTLRNGV